MSNFISISNNTREMYAFFVQDGNRQLQVKLIPGLNLGIKEAHGEQIKASRPFKHYEEKGFLTYVQSDSLDVVENAKEKFGGKLIDNKETGEPMRPVFQDEIGAKKPYLPSKDMLIALQGIGKATADKIIKQGEKASWNSYSDMVADIENDYPNAVFTKDSEVS